MTDELTFERATWRISRIMAAVGLVGAAAATVFGGWKWGCGFLLGAAISGLNFHWLHRLVAALGSGDLPRNRAVVLGFRYLILGGSAYVIVKLSKISLMAVLAGLFVLTAAILVEVVFEVIYARK